MRTQQHLIKGQNEVFPELDFTPNLFLAFGERNFLSNSSCVSGLRKKYPNAIISGCSTSGEILGEKVTDNTVAITAIKFDKTQLEVEEVSLKNTNHSSKEAGLTLAKSLNHEGLKHVLVFSDGLNVNGTELVNGMQEGLPKDVTVTGGLAGDGPNFEQTFIIGNDGKLHDHKISAIGFYGNNIEIGFSSRGGWDSFGVDRLVTKSDGNVLFEIDNQPALDLYKSFLGDQAKELPASGLLFPLSMRDKEVGEPVVRTILATDEKNKSLTFAGDIPEGAFVRLMKANADRLINGAEEAAEKTLTEGSTKTELALLVSCVGRKLVLKQLVEEEVEVVSDVLGKPTITGFYSYGELAPFGHLNKQCELHNQTMTITTISERI